MSELQDKIDLVHEYVSIYDLCDRAPYPTKYETREIECQIACPFHGRDLHKSARIYPQTNSIHCWACAKTWDVISYWAEANEMWQDNGKLAIGKAVNDLCYKFNLRTKKSDWRARLAKNLAKFNERTSGFAGAPAADRDRLKLFYSARIARQLRALTPEVKHERWWQVAHAWDSLDNLDLSGSTWKELLTDWEVATKITLLDAPL